MAKSSELNPIEATYRRLTQAGRKILPLFSGNPNEHGIYYPPQVLEKAYSSYFQNQHYRPHPKGLLQAREAVGHYYRNEGVEVDAENIILTSGTSESFFHLFTLLGKPGDNFLAPNPAYPLFDHLAQLARVELRHYPLLEDEQWAMDVSALADRIDGRTRAIILISPNNPTGAVHSVEELAAVVAVANQNSIPLIVDEVFSEFYFGEGSCPRLIARTRPNLAFTLNGISKMFALPALKLGWIAVTGEKGIVEASVDRLETQADTFLSCHTPIQEALPELFSQSHGFLKSYREQVTRRKELAVSLLERIPRLRFVPPRGGFYLTAQVDSIPDGEEEFVIGLMEEKGVFVHPGYFYDYERGVHIVISYLTREEDLKPGLQAIASYLTHD